MYRLRRRLRDTALAELAAEEENCREIDEMSYSALRTCVQKLYAQPKSDWIGRDYTRELLLDSYFDELDETMHQRKTRFDEQRRELYATHA